MAYRVWPADIDDRPLIDGYSEGLANRIKRFEYDAGPDKLRRSPGLKPWTIEATFFFNTYEKFNRFFEWIEDDNTGLAGGALVFEWRHPLKDKVLEMRFVFADGSAALTGKPHKGQSGKLWSVPVILEVLP